MMFIGATNVIASRLPECRPTETPHARANIIASHGISDRLTGGQLVSCMTLVWSNKAFMPNLSFLGTIVGWVGGGGGNANLGSN